MRCGISAGTSYRKAVTCGSPDRFTAMARPLSQERGMTWSAASPPSSSPRTARVGTSRAQPDAVLEECQSDGGEAGSFAVGDGPARGPGPGRRGFRPGGLNEARARRHGWVTDDRRVPTHGAAAVAGPWWWFGSGRRGSPHRPGWRSLRKEIGATVLSTTRHADRADKLRAMGVDHPVVDNGHLAEKVRDLVPQGVDAALELVGCTVLPDTFGCVRGHGTVCFTGALAGGWSIPGFTPFMIPSGVRLTSYAGEAADLPADVFARQLQVSSVSRC
ncbi:zinc-binding dehydrogenase [Streptomyces sp. NPDC056943]|uniref:zinc-binding dehydrogenase n=1 Tax=Streptomyces sp. NPDC056943 TaxID=3345971 RepID=UPI00362CFAF7